MDVMHEKKKPYCQSRIADFMVWCTLCGSQARCLYSNRSDQSVMSYCNPVLACLDATAAFYGRTDCITDLDGFNIAHLSSPA